MNAFDLPKLPPDALELLNDPRLADLRPRAPGLPNAGETLQPGDPPRAGESRFVIFQTNFEDIGTAAVEWSNKPSPPGPLGRGRGFSTLANATPQLTEAGSKPTSVPGAWAYAGWLIASPKFVATLRSFDSTALETIAIDWSFADRQKLDGYFFLDVSRLLYAYDYRRSVVHVQIEASGKFISSLGTPRALRSDLPADVHIFREAYWRSDIFFSRELAKALQSVESHGFFFKDPASGQQVTF